MYAYALNLIRLSYFKLVFLLNKLLLFDTYFLLSRVTARAAYFSFLFEFLERAAHWNFTDSLLIL